MMRLPALLALTLLLAFAIACGDDDDGTSVTPTIDADGTPSGDADGTPTPTFELRRDLTLEQYFTEIEQIFETANIASNSLIAELDSDIALAESFQQQVEANILFLGDTIEVYSTAIGQMSSLEPPPEAAAYHQDFIDNATEGATIAADLQIQLEDVRTEEQAQDLIQQFEADIGAVIAAADTTACNLQNVALAADLQVELNCAES